jgi:ribosomal protein L16/L10AE
MMQVPCCRGLLQIAQAALQKAIRKVPLKAIIVSTQGEVLSEEWL